MIGKYRVTTVRASKVGALLQPQGAVSSHEREAESGGKAQNDSNAM